MNLLVVESPAKAKTINKYLGSDYTVLASYGHVRDLPAKDGSVRPDEDFAMSWDVDAKAAKRLSDIAEAAKKSDRIILATDPDREGEAISWHVLEVLQKKKVLKDKKVERVVFNAITKSAVTEAMKSPRAIDMELVEAYLARRALDYLVGFTLSPVLWRKLPGSRSAGRVQSVALRLVVDRELEIERFKTQEYWTVEADVSAGAEPFLARMVKHEGKRLSKFDLGNETSALAAKAAVEAATFTVAGVEKKPGRRSPPPPFTTSTLQQEASRKLGFSAQRTMQAAQKLYEGIDIGGETVGLITYMRTDGVQAAPEALDEARVVIGGVYGKEYVPETARIYKTKAKNAQEAHEAIRPTSLARNPGSLRLESDLGRLYELIWKRMIASQMESARIERTTIELESADGKTGLRATGQVVLFDGYLAVYEEGRDDADDEEGGRLPQVNEGASARVIAARSDQHFTEPPPRYSEASLVKKMEELGIGRPSTYASVLTVLRDREYVRMDKNRFVPEDKGRLVTAFLEQFFARYVEYDFTAALEEKLDLVSAGEMDWKALLREFWQDFHAAVGEIAELRVTNVLDALNEALGPHIFPAKEDGSDPRGCPTCGTGRLSLKTGKFGAFIGCSNYPECRFTRQLAQSDDEAAQESGDRELGVDPVSGETVFLKTGRFGPYVQLGEADKPKRSSLPKGWSAAAIDLEKALRLLRLPREVGAHPEDGGMITAGIGRFGPFVLHNGTYANLPNVDEVFDVGINRAVALLAEKRAGGGRPGRGESAALKDLGAHPADGAAVKVLAGRYGPYIKHGATNANVPKGKDPQDITLEEAVALLAEREAKGGGKKKGKAAAKPKAEKAPAKKAAAKKPAAKKPAAKKATKAEAEPAPADGPAPWDDE
ncbi:DNA topoisomerase I [Phenylobacterium sp. Root77]|uniref:type I DNA topoisomerase n=1 Tax=unclassified Phenylobacterium TaxID=2640670 RepID=UPI0006F30A35|nr:MULTISPECIES: type I DNA topoisomerase [unclassified Phenylobacterium]KQW71372.1 DNA topoisomerase I [Phenylobacterium sp. Root1277]KQW94292.1 DNA topoisomerase I [Phenylobacterium sp. Root1290]KRC43986.1 DNA topoisomerase I [Phenylobacterium sp. Root77]